ncbi:MAG: hypothetical protein GF344_01135, partial [Chitinivibrionales bacterium]|nr:hypothetical protein [Chitinivibrionales bacterium]
VPEFAVELYDISHLPDESIRGEMMVRATLMLMKHIFDPHLLEELPRILSLWQEVATAKGAVDCLEIIIRYLAATLPSEKREDFSRAVVKSIKESEGIMPTIAQKWVEEGFEKGVEKGIELGVDKGKIIDKQAVLIHLVDRKFGISEAQKQKVLGTEDAVKLDAALDKILFAGSVEEVLGCL